MPPASRNRVPAIFRPVLRGRKSMGLTFPEGASTPQSPLSLETPRTSSFHLVDLKYGTKYGFNLDFKYDPTHTVANMIQNPISDLG